MPYPKEKQRQYQCDWLKERRRAWIAEHGPCVDCGSRERLEVDHTDPSQKVTHRVWSWSRERRDAELAKCEVRCHDCHWEKTKKQNYADRTHGTATMYGRGKCRCRMCRCHNTIRKRLSTLRVTKKFMA